MENKPEYVATFKSSEQIAIDDWRILHPSLKCTRETTIGEIQDWYSKLCGSASKLKVRIIQMDLLK